VSAHRELSTFCQHRVKDCFRHFSGSIDNRTVVSREIQNALPLYQGCHGSRGDQPQREMAGFCHGVPGAFQVQIARGLTGKPRMGWVDITPAYITAAAGGLGKLAQNLLTHEPTENNLSEPPTP